MVAQTEAAPQSDGSRAFWSPLVIFFLGTPFAALNWWRMGWKRKAIIFLCISIVVNLFRIWLRPGAPYTDSPSSSYFLIFLPLLISILYQLLLAFVISHDIRVFNLSGEKTNAANWTIIVAFIFIISAVSVGGVLGSDYLANSTKYCRFPRFQDFLYANDISNRSGLRQMLMNHYDSGCLISWKLESESSFSVQNEVPKPSDSLGYTLAGRQKGFSNSFILIHQTVELYSQPITQAMVDSQVEQRNGTNINLEIPSDLSHAKLFRYNCFQSEEYQDCIIVLGYEHVLTWFEISQQGFIDGDYEQVLIETIKNVDQRIYEYETNTQ
jgi:hypothetical protein